MDSDRRNLLVGGLGLGATILGAAAVQAQEAKIPRGEAGRGVTMLVARRCFLMVITWDGSDRHTPATIKATVSSNAFDAAAGAYVQQNPGSGGWDEVASFTGMSLTASEFNMTFRRTGGQNYSIWIPVPGNLAVSDVTVSTSGPFVNNGKAVGDYPFPA